MVLSSFCFRASIVGGRKKRERKRGGERVKKGDVSASELASCAHDGDCDNIFSHNSA